MTHCEDFPCCGHEPGCCPDFDPETGKQLNMKCTCGATVPLTSRFSICEGCMKSDDPYDDGDDWCDEDEEDEEDDIAVIEPPVGSWASTARMMAAGDDTGFDWDAWKDEMKERG